MRAIWLDNGRLCLRICVMSERPLSLEEITDRHFAWVVEMGWANKCTPLEGLALIASEVGEAVNECRGVLPSPKFGSELADIILRTLTLARQEGLDIEAEILAKMEKNKLRGNLGRLI